MLYTFSSLISLLALSGVVTSHGFPGSVKVGSTTYPGAVGGGSDPSKSPIRPINNGVDNGAPIDDVNSPDMRCGIGATPAKQAASAKAGDTIQMWWKGPTGIPWFHAAGPIMTYMANCGGDCSSFNPDSSTAWFKISELGEKTPGDPSSWYQADLPAGKPVTVQLPTNLKSGNYLFRQEIVATQNSQTLGKTEFYPSCLQLNVAGSSDGPAPSPTVHFPGAYSASDPGIFGNFYNPNVDYIFPGGKLSNLASSSSSTTGGTSSPPPPSSSDSDPAPAPAPKPASPPPAGPVNVAPTPETQPPAPKATGKSCKRKRSSSSIQKKAMSAHKKRRANTAY